MKVGEIWEKCNGCYPDAIKLISHCVAGDFWECLDLDLHMRNQTLENRTRFIPDSYIYEHYQRIK